MAERRGWEAFAGRRWGVCLRDLPGTETIADIPVAITAAAALGASLLHLPTVRAVSATLDAAVLADTRAAAVDAGVALSASLPPVHPDRLEATWGTDPQAPAHAYAQIAAAEQLGVTSLHVTVGQDEDRFRVEPSWQDQLERVVPVLQALVARAGVPIVLKTHEEMTTFELLELLRAVPGLRVGFSPVNVVARLEDPLAAAERVLPSVHTVFVDDCALARRGTGLERVMRPIGEGVLPWPALLRDLPADAPLVIDLHRAELAMPVYDGSWLAHQPDLAPAELAAVYARASADAAAAGLGRRKAVAAELLSAAARRLASGAAAA